MSLPPIVFAGPSVAGLPLESVVRVPPASAGDMLALADGQESGSPHAQRYATAGRVVQCRHAEHRQPEWSATVHRRLALVCSDPFIAPSFQLQTGMDAGVLSPGGGTRGHLVLQFVTDCKSRPTA